MGLPILRVSNCGERMQPPACVSFYEFRLFRESASRILCPTQAVPFLRGALPERPEEPDVTFSAIGEIAKGVVERAGGDNIVLFPAGSDTISREERMARAFTHLESCLGQLMDDHGVDGGVRVSVLMLTDMARARGASPNASLRNRIAELGAMFALPKRAVSRASI